MKIQISEPDGPYSCTVDTEVMDVSITEAFVGAMFLSPDGEKLAVCMRDTGFEVRYFTDDFNSGWMEFKNGSPPRRKSLNKQPRR